MNTLRDTDEGKGRPSVWEVYAMSALVGVISVGLVAMMAMGVWLWGLLVQDAAATQVVGQDMTMPVFVIFTGLFGIGAAVGASRLRPWGWWAVAVWVLLYFVVAIPDLARLWKGEISHWAILEIVSLIYITLVLIISRRLFFPPEAREGEE